MHRKVLILNDFKTRAQGYEPKGRRFDKARTAASILDARSAPRRGEEGTK